MPDEDNDVQYCGFVVQQRPEENSPRFFVFAGLAKDIRRWVEIRRTVDTPGGAQRMFSKAHAKSITNYLSASGSNIIPTALTISLRADQFELTEEGPVDDRQGDRVRIATLNVHGPLDRNEQARQGLVIDGQHRLLALDDFEEDTPILVSAILDADELEQALQFVVINNKAKRVPQDLVRAIVAELGPEQSEAFRARLRSIGLTLGRYREALMILFTAEESPIKGLVDWDLNRGPPEKRLVKPLALEVALRTISSDLITPSEMSLEESVDLLIAMWNGARAAWDDVTPFDAVESKLLSKAGFVAATEFMLERLNLQAEEGADLTDPAYVEAECERIMAGIASSFWLVPWAATGLDTSAGRSLIRSAMASVRRAASRGAVAPLANVSLLEHPDEG